MNATTVAVDLAKSVFQLAVADRQWIPCRHGSHRIHSKCRIYGCTQFRPATTIGQVSCFGGESIYEG